MASNFHILRVAAVAKTQADKAQAHTQQNRRIRAPQIHVHPRLATPKPPTRFLIGTRGITSVRPAANVRVQQRYELRPATLGPLLLLPTLSRASLKAPWSQPQGLFPVCQQHTLFLASKARQPLAHWLPTGPSLEPDAGPA